MEETRSSNVFILFAERALATSLLFDNANLSRRLIKCAADFHRFINIVLITKVS